MSEEKTASRQEAEGSSGHAHAELETEPTTKQSLTVPPENENADVPKQDASATLCGRDARAPSASATFIPPKTQCVKPARDHGVGVLESAAKKAARSNSRSDVHEYMRIRRSFV